MLIIIIAYGQPGGYFCAPQLMNFMWITWGPRAKKDTKFIDKINNVLICLLCCVIEHQLHVTRGEKTFTKFDNRARGNTFVLYLR